MQRRDFLKSLPALAMTPALAEGTQRPKITDVRLIPLKVLKETGMMEPAWDPGGSTMRRVGGGA